MFVTHYFYKLLCKCIQSFWEHILLSASKITKACYLPLGQSNNGGDHHCMHSDINFFSIVITLYLVLGIPKYNSASESFVQLNIKSFGE